MEHVQIQTAQNVGIDFEVAGLGDRILASLIDYLILFAYLILLVSLITATESLALAIVGFLPFFGYFLLCEIFLNGQSIGKRVRKIKVTRLDGTEPTLGNYLLRWILRPIDIQMFFGLVAVLTIAINERGQRVGDIAAGTTVIKLTPRLSLSDTLFAAIEEDHEVIFPQVDVLTPDEVATAKEVLGVLRSRTVHPLGDKMKAALETKMGIASDLKPILFLRAVVKDYNHVHGRL